MHFAEVGGEMQQDEQGKNSRAKCQDLCQKHFSLLTVPVKMVPIVSGSLTTEQSNSQ